MGHETPVVKASSAKFGKTLLGGFRVDYKCPRCKQDLTTKDDAAVKGDQCPHCSTSFAFDEEIQRAYSVFFSEKQSIEQKRQAQQAAADAAREEKQREKARLEAEAAERRRSEAAAERARWAQSQQDEFEKAKQSARDISAASGCFTVILVLGIAGVAVTMLAAFAAFANSNAEVGGSLFVVGVAGVVSLALTYVLFRILEAIHAVLVMILDRLNSSSK